MYLQFHISPVNPFITPLSIGAPRHFASYQAQVCHLLALITPYSLIPGGHTRILTASKVRFSGLLKLIFSWHVYLRCLTYPTN